MVKQLKVWNMKKDLHLTAFIEKPEILENIIEQLAASRNDMGFGKALVPKTWQALETSSIETYVSGRIEFDYNETQRIRIPYITCFLFSCTKEKNSPYDLTWSFSLS
jgi:hypothetical protein